MKLHHQRTFNDVAFESVTHFSFKDSTAKKLAAEIPKELGIKVRVVNDSGIGFTHVFVELGHWEDACNVAERFI